MGVCGACEADGGRGCPTWPVIQRASMNASLFGSSGHLGASLQRSLGRTSFVLDVLHTAVFTSWKVAGMYSVSMIQIADSGLQAEGGWRRRRRTVLTGDRAGDEQRAPAVVERPPNHKHATATVSA
ncbi:hypothetical protein EVAR_67536_1 [Eumeta japonica]|uniref:Uncharacterized protein n=1 Tax=Eumeta variegata TaxID=151549 RepID=A0A4C1ZUC0_EUMVA|nr:hypothetical protein EVAR_67536_1 [Eumeta japonica]